MLIPSQQTHSKREVEGIPDVLSISFVSFFVSRAISQFHFLRPSLQSAIFRITLNLSKQIDEHVSRRHYISINNTWNNIIQETA